jgi:hypothetical protein
MTTKLTIQCTCGRSVEIGWFENPPGTFPMIAGRNAWYCWPHLVRAGFLKAIHRGPSCYGHTDLYVTPKGRTSA